MISCTGRSFCALLRRSCQASPLEDYRQLRYNRRYGEDKRMEDCIFCRIGAGQVPVRLAYQDEQVVAFHDLNPQAPVHVLIIPRRHLPGVKEMAPEDEPLVGHLLRVGSLVAQQLEVGESGFRLVTNSGPDAGQSVMHLHFHLLGGRPLGWPPG